MPEFQRASLEALRQPLETGRVSVARAAAHVTYPARFQLVAAMNPCRCGHLGDPNQGCHRQPRCGQDYQARLSGPLLDRIDLVIEVPPVTAADLALPPAAERSADVAARVAAARARQAARLRGLLHANGNERDAGADSSIAPSQGDAVASLSLPTERAARGRHIPRTNAEADGRLLEAIVAPDAEGRRLLSDAVERFRLSARGYHRILRVARTLADLEGADGVRRPHIAEALSYRQATLPR